MVSFELSDLIVQHLYLIRNELFYFFALFTTVNPIFCVLRSDVIYELVFKDLEFLVNELVKLFFAFGELLADVVR